MPKGKFSLLLDPKWLGDIRFLEITNKCGPLTVGDGRDCIGISEHLLPEKVLEFALVSEIPHVVQSSGLGFESEVNSSALMLKDRNLFLDFPLSSVFAPTEAGADKEREYLRFERLFNHSDEKDDILNEFETCIRILPGIKTVYDDALLILDELFTNAIYNAPFVDEGNLSVGANRFLGGVSMGPGRQGRIFMGCDQDRLMIGCSDPFGQLNIPALIKRIELCYKNGLDQSIRTDAGGAGIGSFMIYQRCASYYAAVDKGRRTTVCGLLPLSKGYREREKLAKNIHVTPTDR